MYVEHFRETSTLTRGRSYRDLKPTKEHTTTAQSAQKGKVILWFKIMEQKKDWAGNKLKLEVN